LGTVFREGGREMREKTERGGALGLYLGKEREERFWGYWSNFER